MNSPVTFHHPRFDSNIKDKIGFCLQVDSEHSVSQISETPYKGKHAIASFGGDSNIDGTHVFATRIDNIGDACISVGWTGDATWDSLSYDFPGFRPVGLAGSVLRLFSGSVGGSNGFASVADLSSNITEEATEVVSILKISDDGRKKTAQFIVDGHQGKVHDVARCFLNKRECYPFFLLFAGVGTKTTTISFFELKFTSPIIEEFKKQIDSHPPLQLHLPSSTNNKENEKLIAELRREVEEGNRRLLKQKDEQIEEMRTKERQMKEQLEIKDQQLNQHLKSNERMLQRSADEKRQIEKQLELERAEHQKTRNLLHQSKQEMKDMEIHFLKQQLEKESGQRRQREEEEEVQVKQERTD